MPDRFDAIKKEGGQAIFDIAEYRHSNVRWKGVVNVSDVDMNDRQREKNNTSKLKPVAMV
jgi:hypothetical protein